MFGKRFIGTLFASVATIGLMFVSPAARAIYGGNVQFNWSIPNAPADGLTQVAFPTTLNPSTGHVAGNYAAWIFEFTKSGGAYTGLMPVPNENGQTRIHAAYSSFIAGTTSNDPNCSNGADGGPGVSCGMNFDGTYGRNYVITVARVGQDTWEGTVWDTVTGAGYHIGTFKVPAGSGNLRSSQVGFIENWSAQSCAAVPKIDASLGRPQSAQAGLIGDVGGAFEYGACGGEENYSAVTTADGVRIQRGQPTGAIIGNDGLCTDVKGGGAGGMTIQAANCNGNENQQWITTSSKTLQAYGRCMAVKGNATVTDAPIELSDCNGSGGQVWVPQSDGSLMNPQSGKCLTIYYNAGAGSPLVLWPCVGAVNQMWSLNRSAAPIFGKDGLCVGNGSRESGSATQVWTCTGAEGQQWMATSAKTLQTFGKCMGVKGNDTATDAPIQLLECNGSGSQVWVPQADGALVNPQSGKCLTIYYNGGAGSPLVLWPCVGAVNQKWSLNK